jgi:predicted metal-dependent phosphoesterase TrpH
MSMRTVLTPLLSELHAHTTWSDGSLTPRELVDLYGRSGFDVLCITDHTLRATGGVSAIQHVDASRHDAYLADIAGEADRARATYDMLVLPGLELTYDDPDPARSAHALAVGLTAFVGVDAGIEPALEHARTHGAALIAAHPYQLEDASSAQRRTGRWHADPELAALVDRFELINRHDVFPWVAERRLPAVASGDFHRREHLATWKTLLPCEKQAESVVAFLRSPRRAPLVQLAAPAPAVLAADERFGDLWHQAANADL